LRVRQRKTADFRMRNMQVKEWPLHRYL
jgi:hypothetical protein